MNPARAGSLVGRELAHLLSVCRTFVEREGIADLWIRLGAFRREQFLAACTSDLGFVTGDGNRARMLCVLLDLARETGWLVRVGDDWHCPSSATSPVREEPAIVSEFGESAFFTACVEAAAPYLRGGPPGIAFDEETETLWDGFLASRLHEFGRRWVLRKLKVEDTPRARCLDVGYGTGRSTLALCRQFPRAIKVALDTHDRYRSSAAAKTNRVLANGRKDATPVLWAPADLWRGGFDDDLPFASGSFDVVFFSCSEPYLPPGRRAAFYGEALRVLRPGGRLGILTWPYPGPDHPLHPSFRKRVLLHDFAESVCRGWQGFQPAAHTEQILRRIGFQPPSRAGSALRWLEGSAWIAERAALR